MYDVLTTSRLHNAQELWASTIESALAAWLLYRELGIPFIGPIVVVLLSILATSFVATKTANSQTKWMSGIQKRVGITSSMIVGYRFIQFLHSIEPADYLPYSLR